MRRSKVTDLFRRTIAQRKYFVWLKAMCFSVLLLIAGWNTLSAEQSEPTADQIQFFEEKIRPVLAENCYECHGAAKSESDFRLDSRASILSGGASDSPGAIVGEPDKSLLIASVTHTGDYNMPPEKKLSDNQISDLKKWIEIGMPWPDEEPVAPKLSAGERINIHRATHWAFQPVKSPALPDVAETSIAGSPIDRLLADKLKSKGISFSPIAEKRILVRRAYFDLIGLPPTFEEVENFVNDDSPDAWEKLIEHLLASPHYGERWARHWLDVARYSDTRGYGLANVDRRYPFAYTYRDFVIRAFNDDMRFDHFVRLQLAADRVETDNVQDLAALGFVTVGRKYLSNLDTIDDQVDVVTRGLMGLTVSCARCHDHKFDAVPTEDYYSLFSIFENCSEPEELPLIVGDEEKEKHRGFLDELDKLKQAIETYLDKQHTELQQQARTKTSDYLARVIAPGKEEMLKGQSFIELKELQVNKRLLQLWQAFLGNKAPARMAIFTPWHELLSLSDDGFAEAAAARIKAWEQSPDDKLNRLVLEAFQKDPPNSRIEVARVYGNLFVDQATTFAKIESKEIDPDSIQGPQRLLLTVMFGGVTPMSIEREHIRRYLDRAQNDEVKKLQTKIVKHQAAAPEGLSRAMILVERENLADTRVMIRGNAGRRGDVAPRRFLAVLSPDERKQFSDGAGRLELADAIASSENPLTARVFVNRVWMHHFNKPLVDTPSDFGIQCPQPVQHDVLDWLAADFMQHHWSIKHLHRTIMNSHAYRQASVNRIDCAKVDPENRLVWRMNRRRLEFESLRDSLLVVGGNLNRKIYGKSEEIAKPPYSERRTVYAKVDRQDLPNLFRAFDFASPDQSVSRRTRTIVPQQSLFLMNSPFAIEQTRKLVARADLQSLEGRPDRISRLYELILSRRPMEKEIEIGSQFLDNAGKDGEQSKLNEWQRYAQLLLMTNEFEFVD